MRAADLDIVLIPDAGGAGPDDWMRRWERRLGTARLVNPVVAIGAVDGEAGEGGAVGAAIAAAVQTAARPILLVGHGAGSVEAARYASSTSAEGRVAAAFLVAPVDLDACNSDAARRMPTRPLPCPSFLVASRDDPAMRFERAELFAALWRSLLMDAGASGHLDAASGHGPWPEGLLLLTRLLSNLQ